MSIETELRNMRGPQTSTDIILSYDEILHGSVLIAHNKYGLRCPIDRLPREDAENCYVFWKQMLDKVSDEIEALTWGGAKWEGPDVMERLKLAKKVLTERLRVLKRVLRITSLSQNDQQQQDRKMQWRTADGREIAVKDLDNEHLNNIVLHLRRRLESINDPESYYAKRTTEVLQVMEEEVKFRGLPDPIKPIKTLEWIRQQMEEKMDTKETSSTAQVANENAGNAENTKATEGTLESTVESKLRELTKEVEGEFIASSEKVYKQTLRALLNNEQAIMKQLSALKKELEVLQESKKALAAKFLEGSLRTREDAEDTLSAVVKQYDNTDKKVLLRISKE